MMTKEALYYRLHVAGTELARRLAPQIALLDEEPAIRRLLDREMKDMLHTVADELEALGDPAALAAARGLRPDEPRRDA